MRGGRYTFKVMLNIYKTSGVFWLDLAAFCHAKMLQITLYTFFIRTSKFRVEAGKGVGRKISRGATKKDRKI